MRLEIVDDDEAGTDTPAAQEFREARKDNKTWARLIESRLFLVKWSIFCAKINSLGFLFPLSELLFNWGGFKCRNYSVDVLFFLAK